MGGQRRLSTALLVQLYMPSQAWKRPETQRVLLSKLNPFATAFPALPTTPAEIAPYVAQLRARHSEATFRGDWQAIYRFLAWCKANHRTPNSLEGMTPPRKPKTVPQRLEDHEARLIWQYAESQAGERPELLALAMVLLGTGARIGEVAAMRRSHVMRDYLIVPDGKTGQRELPIPHEAFHDVIARIGRGDLLWVFEGRARTAKGLTNTWRMMCEHVGVFGRKAGPHAARHRFAVKVLKASGGDVRLVQYLLGHASLSSTVIYLKLIDAGDVLDRWDAVNPLRGVAA